MKATLTLLLSFALPVCATAHDGHVHKPTTQQQTRIRRLNTQVPWIVLTSESRAATSRPPQTAKWFAPFSKTVKTRFDQRFLYVESNGMPAHPMMIGIRSWQQQVPIPQPYTGENAWRIPLNPVPSRNPLSAKTKFFRGAIALAANGVPIFNPIKNDGRTDTFLAGELDQWGGHCGRADDYHYHIAPVHLEKIVGKGKPIAVALDGYPIYGYNDPNGRPPTNLDWLNGHKDAAGNYHYHATKNYPYLNGGFYGEVTVNNGGVEPQPRGQGIRPFTRPLRGAKITGFEKLEPSSYRLEYDVYGDKRSIRYTMAENGTATFAFTDSTGTRTETYRRRERRPRDRGPSGNEPASGRRPRNGSSGLTESEIIELERFLEFLDREGRRR